MTPRTKRWALIGLIGLIFALSCAFAGVIFVFPNAVPVQHAMFHWLATETGLSFRTERLRVDLLRGRLWVRGLTLASKQAEKLIELDSLEAEFRPRDLLHGRVLLDRVTIERPRVWVTYPQEGEDNWSRALAGGKPSEPGVGGVAPLLHAADVTVRDATFVYHDAAGKVLVRLDGINVQSDFDLVGPSATGRVKLDGGEIKVEDLRIPIGPTTGEARWTGGGLEGAKVDATSGMTRVHATGTMEGILEGTIKIDTETSGTVDLSGLAALLAGDQRFHGSLSERGPFRLRGSRVEMDLELGAQTLDLAGVPARDVAGTFALAGTRVTVGLRGSVRDLPVQMGGTIEETGTHTVTATIGPVDASKLPPELRLAGLTGILSARATSQGPFAASRVQATVEGSRLSVGPLRLGDLEANLRAYKNSVEATVETPPGAPLEGFQLEVQATSKGKDLFHLPERLTLAVSARGRNMDTTSFYPASPVTGRLSFDFTLSGAPSRLEGGGPLSVENGSIAGITFRLLSARMTANRVGLAADPFSIQLDGASAVSGSASVTWRGEGSGSLAAQDHPLALVSQRLGPQWNLDGKVNLQADLSFSDNQGWGGRLDAKIEGLSVRGENLGDLRVEATASSGRIEAHATGSAVEASGWLVPKKSGDFHADVRIHDASLKPLAARLGIDLDRALTSGVLQVDGNLTDPLAARGILSLDRLDLAQNGNTMGLPRPARLTFDRKTLRAEPFEVLAAGLPVRIEGTVSPDALDVRAGGVFDLASFSILSGFFRSVQGTARGEIRATGPPSHPNLVGDLGIAGASLRPRRGFPQIRNLNLHLQFDGDTIRIARSAEAEGQREGDQTDHKEAVAEADVGDGHLSFSGELRLKGFRPESIAVSLHGTGIRYVRPNEYRLTLASDLHLEGPLDGPTLSGSIDIQKGRYEKNISLIREILTPARTIEVRSRWGLSFLEHLKLDLRIGTPGTLRVENNLVSLDLRGDLRLTGTAAEPELEGRIAVQKGTWSYLGPAFHIVSGAIDFNDPYQIEPTLEVEAQTLVRGYLVTLRIEGPLEKPNPPELTAVPALDQEEILSLLVGGRVPSGETAVTGAEKQSTRSPALAAGVAAGIAGTPIKELTGLDLIAVEQSPEVGGGALAKIGKKVGERTNLTYTYPIGTTDPAEVQAEVELSDNFFVFGSEDSHGRFGFGLELRMEFP